MTTGAGVPEIVSSMRSTRNVLTDVLMPGNLVGVHRIIAGGVVKVLGGFLTRPGDSCFCIKYESVELHETLRYRGNRA